MSHPLGYFLPFGVVRSAQIFKQLRILGLSRRSALAAAAQPSTNQRLHNARLHLLPPGSLARLDCVIDAGANVGNWSQDLLCLCVPQSLLVVEPDPRLLPGLNERFKGHPQVQIHHVALGAEAGSLPFHQMAQSDMNSLLEPTADTHQAYGEIATIRNTIQVPVRTLDSLTTSIPKVDLLKLDVQGFEQHALRGGAEMLQRTKAVLLELNFISHYQGDLRFHELDRMMNDLGFALYNYSHPARNEHCALWADGLYLRQEPGRSLPNQADPVTVPQS